MKNKLNILITTYLVFFCGLCGVVGVAAAVWWIWTQDLGAVRTIGTAMVLCLASAVALRFALDMEGD